MPTTKIFLSYSRSDSEKVARLADDLRAAGLDVWIDKSGISLGQIWDSEITKAIDHTDFVLGLLSRSAVASNNVKGELTYAIEKGKTVVPVRLEECELPLFMRMLQCIDLYVDYEVQLETLIKALDPRNISTSIPELRRRKNARKRMSWILALFLFALGVGLIYWFSSDKPQPGIMRSSGLHIYCLSKKEGFNFNVSDCFKAFDSMDLALPKEPHKCLSNFFYSDDLDSQMRNKIARFSSHDDTTLLTIHVNNIAGINGIKLSFDTSFFYNSGFMDLNPGWFSLGSSHDGRQHELVYIHDIGSDSLILYFKHVPL